MQSDDVSSIQKGGSAKESFSFKKHFHFILLGLLVVVVVWLIALAIVGTLHKKKRVKAGDLRPHEQANVKRLASNDIAAIVGVVAGLATLCIALFDSLPLGANVVLGVTAAGLALVSGTYLIVSGQHDANTTYPTIGSNNNHDNHPSVAAEEKTS